MKENRCMQVLVAAVVIVIAGCVIALAETVDVEVEVDEKAATRVEVRTDDTIDVFTLDDLADGEERVIKEGDHTITVRRDGDDITVEMDGEALDAGMPGHGPKIRKMIMMGEPGEGEEKKIIKMGGMHGAHGAHFGKVRYRCEETGSMLLVDPEHATEETLIDPASGCVMTKVTDEEPKVIMIKKELTIIDEE